jgi:SnoaL-like domain
VDDGELARLTRRLAELEDKFEILQLVAAYGPTIDGGAAREAGQLWTDDCWYDSDASSAGDDGVRGREAIEAVSTRCGEAQFGIAHISHLPMIKVDGDRATAIDHSNTFHQQGDEFVISRVSSNRWDLVRVDGRWRIERRVNRLLDGSPGSKAVFAEGGREILGS